MSLQLVRTLLKHSVELGGFGKVLDKINIVSAGEGQLTAEMKVEEEHTNYMGTLHGGLSATIIDNLSSYALVTYKPNQNRGSSIDLKISIVSVDHGKIVAEMKVGAEHLNVYNTLHGGLIATIVDVIPSLGHFTHPNGARGGSSATTNLDISYLNSAKVGDEIVITANTVKAGKTLAFLEAKITEKTSGKVIATATHIKFVKD